MLQPAAPFTGKMFNHFRRRPQRLQGIISAFALALAYRLGHDARPGVFL